MIGTTDRCHICTKPGAYNLCPDRAEGCELVYALCTECLDRFLLLFPITMKKIRDRELGKYR